MYQQSQAIERTQDIRRGNASGVHACRFWRSASVALLSVWMAATPALAEKIGKLDISIAGRKQTLTIDDSSAGVDTYWNVGPVSILVKGKKGGTILLTFDENGLGPAGGARMTLKAADGSVWQDVDGSFAINLTVADNLPPKFRIGGTFEGLIENGNQTRDVSGRFQALLSRQDFAPTPEP